MRDLLPEKGLVVDQAVVTHEDPDFLGIEVVVETMLSRCHDHLSCQLIVDKIELDVAILMHKLPFACALPYLSWPLAKPPLLLKGPLVLSIVSPGQSRDLGSFDKQTVNCIQMQTLKHTHNSKRPK